MATFKIDTREFDRTLRNYSAFSSRDVRTIVNTKAFYIARRAVIETPKANSKEVREFSNKLGFKGAQMAGIIINKRRGNRNEKGLYGKPMAKAVAMMKAARLKSVSFLKSGWLPAIKTLQPLAEKIGAQNVASTIRQVGKVKGAATPAGTGPVATAIIQNMADAKHDTKDALMQLGGPALQRAIDFETRSMRGYVERKLRQSASSLGIRTR